MDKRPNFLIIMTDQQRADCSGVAGQPVRAPHLKALAAQGVRFTNAFCTSPHCCPSRASFFSGLLPSEHGIWNNVLNEMALSSSLSEGVRLFSEDLAGAGYENHYFGKWHVSGTENPADRGWQEHSVSARKEDRNGLRWEDYRKLAASPPAPRRRGEIESPGYNTPPLFGDMEEGVEGHDEIVTREVLEELDRLKRREDSGGPWCIYAGLHSPHDPYKVPDALLERIDPDSVELPASFKDSLEDKPRAYRIIRDNAFAQMDEGEAKDCLRHYYALCASVDDYVGRILEGLSSSGMEGETVVVFCSDHGDYGGEHGLFCKGVPCFDSAYRVPLILRLPEGLRGVRGRECSELVSLSDLAPTILELAGLPADSGRFSGRSLLPLLTDSAPRDGEVQEQRKRTTREALFMQTNGVELYYCQRIIRTERYKLVFNGYDMEELYDLLEDPDEMRNLAVCKETEGPEELEQLESIRRELYRKLWSAAYEAGDGIINEYFTVRTAGIGPAAAFG